MFSGARFSINEVSRLVGVAPNTSEIICKGLYIDNFLDREIVGQSHLYGLNNENLDAKLMKKVVFPYLLNFEELFSLLKSKTVISAYLYGSCADGSFNSKSDLDIFLLTPEKLDFKKITEIIYLLKNKFKRNIQIANYGLNDLPRLKKLPFFEEIKRGIKIYGEEI